MRKSANYPAQEGPLSSQRFEAHRIGMEDYELLSLVRLKNSSKAAELIDHIVQSFDHYSTDISRYRQTRVRLLESVDGL